MMITPTHIKRRLPLLVGLAGLCVVAALLVAWVERPRSLRTHKDTVIHVLEQRGIAYREVTFTQSYEDSVELDFFRAAVQVHLPDGRIAQGWIGCEDRDSICFLELRSIGIVGVSLPEITREERWPWLEWLRRYWPS